MTTGRQLTDEQERAVTHAGARLQILACAGSGKTEILARRAVRLLREGVDPASIIAFTFTEKAATELKARIEARAAEFDESYRELPPGGRGMFIGTTHGWALEALRRLGGRYETVDPVKSEQEWALLHRVARRLGVVDLYAKLEGKPNEKVAAAPAIGVFQRSAEVVCNDCIDRDALHSEAEDFSRVLSRYTWLLGEMRLLPFRLMIMRAAEELVPGERLWSRLRGKIRHVLVDEFQDFNPAQDLLLSRIANTGAALTVVADDDQAIYQWRGGDVRLFVSFAKRYPVDSVELGLNHRSKPEIVAFAKCLVDALPEGDRLPKTLRASRSTGDSGSVEVAKFETEYAEARGIAGRIEALERAGHRYSDIAVLYRSVRTSAGPLVEALREKNIPAAVIGKTSLLVRPEIALVVRILVHWAGDGLQAVWYPNAENSAEAVTRESIVAAIKSTIEGDDTKVKRVMRRVDELGQRARSDGVRDGVALLDDLLAVLELPGARNGARDLELGLGQLSELVVQFDHAVRRAAPAELYRDLPSDKKAEADEDASVAGEAGDVAAKHVLGKTRGEIYLMRLKAFLEEYAGRASEEGVEAIPEGGNAVTIMTVHQAKGLEFPIVFVPGLVKGRFPSARTGRRQPWYVPEKLFDRRRYEGRREDEARLLYVALTRAKDLLVVSWFDRHRVRRAQPSPFLTTELKGALGKGVVELGSSRPEPVSSTKTVELIDIDFTTLVTYIECGYRYWLGQICGFQPLLATELGFGKLLHHLVAELARAALSGEQPSGDYAERLLAESFYLPFAGPISADNLRRSASQRIQSYVLHHGKELTRVIEPEVRFEVPLDGARVHGRIDLMLRAEGGSDREVELIDFKTSANRPPSALHENQLRVYSAAVERMGFDPVVLAIHDLDAKKGGRIVVANDERQREHFHHSLQGWVNGIRGGDFNPNPGVRSCGHCDYRRFCVHAPSEVRSA